MVTLAAPTKLNSAKHVEQFRQVPNDQSLRAEYNPMPPPEIKHWDGVPEKMAESQSPT
jgi:hypothetical protein